MNHRNRGGSDRISNVMRFVAFYLSSEFQETGYLVYKAYQASFNTAEHLDLRDFLPDTQEIGRGAIVGQPGADQQLEANKQMFFLESATLRAQVLRSSTPRFSVPAITD